MHEKIGIRFKRCGKIYFFDAGELDLKRGDQVIVESSLGLTIGWTVTDKLPVEQGEKDLKKIIRKTTEEDFTAKKNNEELEREARNFCVERIKARGLQMKLVCTEATLDRKRIMFYFTADGRIDFRELVKDLASRFRTRIEMRQVGVRDETKLLGGFGICGRETCCKTFLTSFAPISIKMAKKQELVLNTSKLSGLCGRLMCCLNYELEQSGPGARKRGAERRGAGGAEEAYEELQSAGEQEFEQLEEVAPVSGPAGTLPSEPGGTAPEGAATEESAPGGAEAQGEQGTREAGEPRRRKRRRFRRHRKKRKEPAG